MRKISFKSGLVVIFLISLVTLTRASDASLIDTPAPDFSVRSGSGDILTLADISGKIAGLFYQPRYREIVEQQKPFEEALDAFFKSLSPADQGRIFRGAFIDTHDIPGLFRWLTRMKMRSQSKKLGITVYGDWTGDFAAAYHTRPDQFNFYLIDASGKIIHQHHGPVSQNDSSRIIEMLRDQLKKGIDTPAVSD